MLRALIHRSVGAQQSRPHPIARVGHIGVVHGLHGQLQQFLWFQNGSLPSNSVDHSAEAKLRPGVSRGASSSSATVAAMSAKLDLVPKFTGFTRGPRTTRGTYSRVWSVVAV